MSALSECAGASEPPGSDRAPGSRAQVRTHPVSVQHMSAEPWPVPADDGEDERLERKI